MSAAARSAPAGFTRRRGALCVDGLPLAGLARTHGTPLYVYSAALVAQAFDAYRTAFAGLPHRVCFALKANSNASLLRLLAARGAGADIVSGGELRCALRAGFAPQSIVFAGVGKSDAELELGLQAGVGAFHVESAGELHRLDRLARARGVRARVALRVNPDIDARSHPYISTGLRRSKFGIAAAEALELARGARRRRGIEVVGLQAHIGSQITSLGPLVATVAALAALSRRLLAEGLPLRSLDIGGGLGIDYTGRTRVPSPRALARRVVPLLRGLPLELLLEPGRSIVGPAGVLLTRVLEVKQRRGRRFVVVDAGMNDLLRPALYGAFHRLEPLRAPRRTRRVVDVVGPVCESSDFLAEARSLPELRSGELLAVRDAGAYGYSMASCYNLRPRPAEVLVRAGRARLVRRRETFEDLVRAEL